MDADQKLADEIERLRVLRSYALLDTAAETNFDSIVQLAARLTGATASMVSLIDTDRQWFKARFGIELTETSRNSSLCAHAILKPTELLVVKDTHEDPRFVDSPLVVGDPKIRFYAGQPLVNYEGFALGTLCVVAPEPRELSEDQRYTLKVLADSLMTAIEFRRQARVDGLTGLPNRTAFVNGLEQAIGNLSDNGRPFSLLYLDLDGFKTVNDVEGHAGGDRLLRTVAVALADTIRPGDLVARIGGDEFAVLVQLDAHLELPKDMMCTAISDVIRSRCSPVTASIGVATFMTPPCRQHRRP